MKIASDSVSMRTISSVWKVLSLHHHKEWGVLWPLTCVFALPPWNGVQEKSDSLGEQKKNTGFLLFAFSLLDL